MRFIEDGRRAGGINIHLTEADYLGRSYELCVRDEYFFCRAGITTGGVMVNGDIAACPNIDRRFAQGNVFRDSFIDIWDNQYQVFRDRRWMRQGECAGCGEWRYCQGGSFHLWDLDAGRPKLCYCRDLGM